MSRLGRLLPLAGFLLVVVLFGFAIWWNTRHVQNYVPSPLIGKPAPSFALPYLYDPSSRLTRRQMLGKAYLLNVFASWCVACGQEHPVLMADGQQLGVPLLGYDYKDKPADARAWLSEHGNPYDMVVVDRDGDTAIDFGVYGAPETFLIDARGIIRYKHIGPITPQVIRTELEPAIARLKGGSS